MSKFAPITSSLLARKGEAGPSVVPMVKFPFLWSNENEVAEAPAEIEDRAAMIPANESAPKMEARFKSQPTGGGSLAGPLERKHKISVALSAPEHETLGIIAVKRGLTRHQVVRNAIDFYFETLAREYRTQCNCIANGCSCAGECSAA